MVESPDFCKICNITSLPQLKLCIHLLPVICDGKDGISTLKSGFDLVFRIDVGCNAIDPSSYQGLGIWLGRITCDAPDFELIRCLRVAQDRIDDRTTLITGGTKYDEDLLVSHDGEVFAGLATRGGIGLALYSLEGRHYGGLAGWLHLARLVFPFVKLSNNISWRRVKKALSEGL